MKPLVCEQCGGALRLSVEDSAYRCEERPDEHTVPRIDAEQRWLELSPEPVDRADTLGAIATMAWDAGDHEGCQAHVKERVAILSEAYEEKPEMDLRAKLVTSLEKLALVCEATMDRVLGLASMQRMLELLEEQRAESSDDPRHVQAVSACLNGIGRIFRMVGDTTQAIEHFDREIELLKGARSKGSEHVEILSDLAAAHFNRYLVTEERDDEKEHLYAAVAAVEILAANGAVPAHAAMVRDRAQEEMERLGMPLPPQTESSTKAGEPEHAPSKASTQTVGDDSRQWLVAEVNRELDKKFPRERAEDGSEKG